MKETTPRAGKWLSRGEDQRRMEMACGEVLVSVIRSCIEPRIEAVDASVEMWTSIGIEELGAMVVRLGMNSLCRR